MSYVPVKNRAVILLSSHYQTASVSSSETKKPTVILDYNATKGALADKMLKEFSCHRISKRWLVVLLAHLINVGTLNAYVLFKQKYAESSMTRLDFLKELSVALVTTAMQTRASFPRIRINSSVQDVMRDVLGDLPPQPLSASSLGQVTNTNASKRNRCCLCIRSIYQKYRARCSPCHMWICPEHTDNRATTYMRYKC